ncbi:MAG: hydrogenase 4 subunit D [Coriobacteriaceae bacterium]|nr:hydrogenase 4 subunit D [Coriobacteriaceae bacterium]
MGPISILALTAIIIPFVGALFIAVLPRVAGRAICITAAAISTAATIVVWILLAVAGDGTTVYLDLVSFGQTAVITLVFDKMSVMLAAAFVAIGLLISIYSVGYLNAANREHPDEPRRRFYAYFAAFIGAMAGLVYSDTLIAQLLFFEITGACSWGLISYYGTETAQKAATKALIVTHIASLGLYIGAGLLFWQTGTFATEALADLSNLWKIVVLICIIVAAWGKSAQLPFYMWLPSAMEAPTPVSAYLHGASMVKVGVAILARALVSAGAIPEPVGWVIIIGAIATMLFSFFMYLPQRDMKRLLAFSTISQLSYIFLAFGFFVFGSDLALSGGIQHIFNHAFAKTLLFLVAGAFSFAIGTRMLPKIKGVLKKYPILAVAFVCGALAIAGCPPFSGFFSKFQIFAGSFAAADGNWLLLLIVIVGLVETAACFIWFLRWIGSVVPGNPSTEVAKGQAIPKSMVAVFVVLIVMTVCSSFLAASWMA